VGSEDDQEHSGDAPAGDAPSAALDYAATVARTVDAHLTSVAFLQDLASAGALFDGTAEVVLNDYRREVDITAEVAKARFQETWRREGLSAESIVLTAEAINLPELLARTARRFDLTILPQVDPTGGTEDTIIEAASLGSGRPILIINHCQKGGAKFERVLVCWDGSHNAARAMADAMPFLARAKQAEVLTVAPDEKRDVSMSERSIAHHLCRHDVSVEIRDIVAHGQDVSLRNRSHAAQQAADLVVMGGYGHSRIREFILVA
jgi:hypothetical protein